MEKRPRHPRKDLEKLIQTAEDQGWTFTKGNRYYKGRCPCGKCMETVSLTPSNPNFAKNKLNKMSKCELWEASK